MAALEDWMRQAKVTREQVAKRSGHEPGYVLAMFDESEPNPKLNFYLDLLEAAGARMETAGGNTTRHVVSRINELRELCDLKIAALAKKSGMHRPHLSRIINDNNPNMQLAVFDALVDALGAYRELRLVARTFTSRMPLALAAGAETMSSGGPPPPPRPNLQAVTGVPPERRTAPPSTASAATAGPRSAPLQSVSSGSKAPERTAPPQPANENRTPQPDPRLVAAEERAAQEKARADAANGRADAAFTRASQERARADAEKARADKARARAAQLEEELYQQKLAAEAELARLETQAEAFRLDGELAAADAHNRRREAEEIAEIERYRAREQERRAKNAKILGWTLGGTAAILAGSIAYANRPKRT